jgi:hypothetical protein
MPRGIITRIMKHVTQNQVDGIPSLSSIGLSSPIVLKNLKLVP